MKARFPPTDPQTAWERHTRLMLLRYDLALHRAALLGIQFDMPAERPERRKEG